MLNRCKIDIVSMSYRWSNRYRIDVVTTILTSSIWCGFDVDTTMWIRRRYDVDSTSLRYGFDVVTIWIRYRCDVDSTSLRGGFDVVTMWIRRRYDVDSTLSQRGFDINTMLIYSNIIYLLMIYIIQQKQ
jgi:hypothetical protein